MLRILREGLPCPVVLSTHVDVEALREALPAKGYRIERERLVREDRRFYVIMHVVLGFDRPYAGADAYIGRNLLGDPLLEEYIDWREGVARRAGAGGDALWKRRLVWIEEARAWNKNC